MQIKMVSLLSIGTHGKLHGLELTQREVTVHGEDMVEVSIDMVKDRQELLLEQLLQLQGSQELV